MHNYYDDPQWLKRVKTLLWTAMWLSLATFVDSVLAGLGMLNLPTIDVLGQQVNTAVLAGLVLNQVSKYFHSQKGRMLH